MNPPNTAPRIGSVLETALYVDDLQRSIEFYQRVLGFKSASDPSSRMSALEVTPDQVLLLFKKGGSVQATVTPFGTFPRRMATARCTLRSRSHKHSLMPGESILMNRASRWKASYLGLKVARVCTSGTSIVTGSSLRHPTGMDVNSRGNE